MNIPRPTAAIILAAGSSSRMGGGRHKLLLPLGDRPVVAHVLDATLASLARPIILVLGHQASEVRAQLATYLTHPDIIIVENPDYLQGMSTSMHVGLQVLMKGNTRVFSSPTPGSALIMLGDQPLITPTIIDTLIKTHIATQKRIVAPLYEGKRGNPILFDESLFPELLEVTGDEGGRSVVQRHSQEVATVELSEAMASYDVDTWEAYQQVMQVWKDKPCLS
jgi:molybdenum cofactor cytidylyltransferase